MNGPRYEGAPTAEGRLAAILMELLDKITTRNLREHRSDIVDYADIETTLRPYVEKELSYKRLDMLRDVRAMNRDQLIQLETVLVREIADLESEILQLRATADANPP